MLSTVCSSQSIDFEKIGKEKWLRYNGGISANAVYYDGTANRQDLTYYLTGSLNFNIAGVYSIPLSFSYSNQNFDFPNPFKFNRLSLHPSYKWITAHIGDVSMTFSPYTLSGHQFTGGGFDLAPEKKWKLSAMYGRFLKATEYDENASKGLVAYKRMGYGLKASYDFEFMKFGAIFFKASDEVASIENQFPIELGISPKDNAVISFESEFRLLDKASIRMEYAISGITEDTRLATPRENNGLLSFLLKENNSTQYYNALNVSFSYPAGNGSLGAGYERIDPDYKTLGAYYFNNDLENITINASQTLFNNKLSLSLKAGLQQDNLNKEKSSEQQQIVSSINANYTASDRLGLTGSFSNFQSYTNIRDQFDYINQVGDYDNVDTQNYRQISTNVNLGINYILKKSETKQSNANLNMVYQTSKNEQEGEETYEDGKNSFYNATAAYTMGYPKKNLNISLAANTSLNTTAQDNSITLGPTLSISKKFFDKKLRTNFSSSYNTSFSNAEQQNSVYNFRLGNNYVWLKKHNFSLNCLLLFRNSIVNSNTDFTLTFGYGYAFDNLKLNIRKRDRIYIEPKTKTKENILSFRYRNVLYSGTIPELNEQLTNVFKSDKFVNIPQFKVGELVIMLATTKEKKKEQDYKESALLFLKELYSYEDFLDIYNKSLFTVINRIKRDMRKIDLVLENSFVNAKVKVDKHKLHKKEEISTATEEEKEEYGKLKAEQEDRLKKLVGHRWMESIFLDYNSLEVIKKPEGYLKEFIMKVAAKSYEIYEKNNGDTQKMESYLEISIIDFYYKESLTIVDPEKFNLKYINKH